MCVLCLLEIILVSSSQLGGDWRGGHDRGTRHRNRYSRDFMSQKLTPSPVTQIMTSTLSYFSYTSRVINLQNVVLRVDSSKVENVSGKKIFRELLTLLNFSQSTLIVLFGRGHMCRSPAPYTTPKYVTPNSVFKCQKLG